MDRSARHLIAAALSLTAAACTADDDVAPLETCEEAIAAFDLSRPSGFVDLKTGFDVDLAWPAPEATGITVDLALVEGDRVVELPSVLAGIGALRTGVTRGGDTIPMGVYHIRATFRGCPADTTTVYDAGALRLVFARGVRFADDAVTLSAAAPDPELDFETVSLSSVQVELRLDPTPGGAGRDDLLLPRVAVPGELVAMQRHLTFTGLTAGGDPIPYGVYRVTARVFEPVGDNYTDFSGPLLTWNE